MRELVERMVKQIVERPEEVDVREVEGGEVLILEVSSAKEDLGKIIGKRGRVANAMRVIAGAAAARLGKRVMIEILEE